MTTTNISSSLRRSSNILIAFVVYSSSSAHLFADVNSNRSTPLSSTLQKRWRCSPVCLFVCLFVCLSPATFATKGVPCVFSTVETLPVKLTVVAGAYSWPPRALHSCIELSTDDVRRELIQTSTLDDGNRLLSCLLHVICSSASATSLYQ